jgi:putative N-acetylmannosamine-6-phosphate epimerase
MKTVLDNLKGKLIVSCQALDNEPLHSPFIMSRMAVAAEEGGAEGFAPTAWRTLLPLNSWFHCR